MKIYRVAMTIEVRSDGEDWQPEELPVYSHPFPSRDSVGDSLDTGMDEINGHALAERSIWIDMIESELDWPHDVHPPNGYGESDVEWWRSDVIDEWVREQMDSDGGVFADVVSAAELAARFKEFLVEGK